jgi:TldD protein
MAWRDALEVLMVPGAAWADLFREETTTTVIALEAGRIDRAVTGRESGVGLRIVAGGRTCHAHTNDPDPGAVMRLASGLASEAAGGKDTPLRIDTGRPNSTGGGAPRAEMAATVELIRLADRLARGVDSRIRQVSVTVAERESRVSIASPAGEVEGLRRDTVMAVSAIAGDGTVLERGYETAGGSTGASMLDAGTAERLALAAAERVVRSLGARPAPAGRMPVILSAAAGGTMVHEAIGHGLENDLAGQGFSVYTGRIGQQVASPLVSVVDDPSLPGMRGSYDFDDEGVASRRNLLVDRGVLRCFISDILSADRWGGATTGNGRRQSYRHLPIPRMSNTMILPGEDDPAAILADTPTGLFVVRMGGGQVNTVNGDFVFEVSEGYLIDRGTIGAPVRGALLMGNGPEVLRSIDRVGSDLGWGIGTCGKDGQGVPVADAQPTLRIPELTVGGRVQ